jgi:outer membrane usher protein
VAARIAQAQEAREVEFDGAFFTTNGGPALDVSRFALGNPVLPGTYHVDIRMNGEWQARRPVRFESVDDRADAHACFARDELIAFGVDPAALPPREGDTSCLPLERRLDSATARFDVGQQRLDIEVPQAAMLRHRTGTVPPEHWDDGIAAGLLSWRLDTRHTSGLRRNDTTFLAAGEAGVNVGAWRLRHAGSWAGERYGYRHTYVERSLAAWRVRMRVGDMPLTGEVLSPVRLRGISVATDMRMAADGTDGYAPRVKGVALAHARVRVMQAGVVLRELLVPPGPFDIDDLYAATRGGDIEVQIEEQGRLRTFRVPYFPAPELLREGHTSYAFSAGRAVVARGAAPAIVQASWRHGFARGVTTFAGGRASSDSASLLLGSALPTRAGTVSAEVTHSRLSSDGQGMLWRVRHGRLWGTSTLVSVGVARGYERQPHARSAFASRQRAIRRFDVLMQRELAGRGVLGVSVSHASDGSRRNTDHEAISWGRHWSRLSVDLTLRRSRRNDASGRSSEATGQLSLSMPLGLSPSGATVYAGVPAGARAGAPRIGLHGIAGAEGTTQYGLALARHPSGRHGIDASLSRRLPWGDLAGAVARSASARAASISASGGLVVHAGGVTPAQRLGDAVALVHARGARGAGVATGAGTRIGRRGYAVAPHLLPYRWNPIDLDPGGTSFDVGFASTHRRVAPTAGAVVRVPFETEVATTRLVTARLADGRPVPFGAEVLDSASRSVGLVGQGGRIFLRSEDTAGRWALRWAGDAAGQCTLRLHLPAPTAASPRYTGVCE